MAATRSNLNKNHSGVKRIMAEARQLSEEGSADFEAHPLEEDIFDWHATIRGPPDTEFEGGLYHARIVLPPEYPFKAPSIMLLTPNGRFELNKKICISFTSYHEDLWQPSWGVRTALIGLQSFFPVKGEGAMGVGGIEVPSAERKRLAKLSRDWVCPHCNLANHEALPETNDAKSSTKEELQAVSTVVPAESPSTPEAVSASFASSTEVPLVAPSAPETVRVATLAPASASARVPVSTSSASASTRPIDLTPSTPAARHLAHLPRDGDRATVAAFQRPKRAVPVALDLAIAVLAAVLAGLVVRRFL